MEGDCTGWLETSINWEINWEDDEHVFAFT